MHETAHVQPPRPAQRSERALDTMLTLLTMLPRSQINVADAARSPWPPLTSRYDAVQAGSLRLSSVNCAFYPPHTLDMAVARGDPVAIGQLSPGLLDKTPLDIGRSARLLARRWQ